MADLDDFFAKRDKKKSKAKKFDTAEDLAKILDHKAKEKKKLETGKSNYLPEGGRQSPGPGLPAGDDDEWLEAEDKKPDFSNLKIQELVLSDEDDDEAGPEGGNEEGGGNEGPWKKKKAQVKEKENEEETEKEKAETKDKESEKEEGSSEEKEKDESKEAGAGDAEGSNDGDKEKPKAYVPPSMRRQQQQEAAAGAGGSAPPVPVGSAMSSASAGGGGGAYVPPSRRGLAAGPTPTGAPKKKPGTVPTLEDAESFPSLS